MVAVQFKFVDNRRIDTDLFQGLFGKIDDVRKAFYTKIVTKVVELSPVDTGTYMDSHEVTVGRTTREAEFSSNRKPRRQPYEPYAKAALSRLLEQIANLPSNADDVHIGNYAIHASMVEHGGANWDVAYSPYRRARAMTSIFLNEAISETGKI